MVQTEHAFGYIVRDKEDSMCQIYDFVLSWYKNGHQKTQTGKIPMPSALWKCLTTAMSKLFSSMISIVAYYKTNDLVLGVNTDIRMIFHAFPNLTLRRGVKISKFVALDKIQRNRELDPHWVNHNFGLLP